MLAHGNKFLQSLSWDKVNWFIWYTYLGYMFQIFEEISKMIITAYLVDYSFTLKKIKLLILVLKASSEIESFERSLHNVISGDSSSRLLCFDH